MISRSSIREDAKDQSMMNAGMGTGIIKPQAGSISQEFMLMDKSLAALESAIVDLAERFQSVIRLPESTEDRGNEKVPENCAMTRSIREVNYRLGDATHNILDIVRRCEL